MDSTGPAKSPGGRRSGRLNLPLTTGDGRTVSLILSLIHVRVPASITVYFRALSRVYRPSLALVLTVILNTEKRKVGSSTLPLTTSSEPLSGIGSRSGEPNGEPGRSYAPWHDG